MSRWMDRWIKVIRARVGETISIDQDTRTLIKLDHKLERQEHDFRFYGELHFSEETARAADYQEGDEVIVVLIKITRQAEENHAP